MQDVKGTAVDLEVLAPSGSGTDIWSVGAFPLDIVIGSSERARNRFRLTILRIWKTGYSR